MMASTLNPYAPPFVPCCYRAVEDFSGEWWRLVKSSPWFRDFWLRERFNEEKLVGLDPDDLQLADSYGSVLHSSDPQQEDEEEERKINEWVDLMAYESVLHFSDPQQEEEEEKINERVDLMAWGADKGMETRCRPSDMRRCSEKAHKFVKSSPWFRDFWLREQFNEEKLVGLDPDELELAYESVLHSSDPQQKEEKRKKMNERVDLMAWGADKWMETRCRPSDMRRCSEKAHKFVSLRVSPRTIQQPR